MSVLAKATVYRKSIKPDLHEIDKVNGFGENETSYEAYVLQFENAKAWVLRIDTKTFHWVNVALLAEGEAVL